MTCGDLTATCDDYNNHFDNAAAAIDELYLKWQKKESRESKTVIGNRWQPAEELKARAEAMAASNSD